MGSTNPYPVSGTVYDTDSTTALASVKVTIRNESSNATLSANSDSNGRYRFDCANFSGGWNNGDILSVFVIYQNFQDKEERTIDTSLGGLSSVNLVLVSIPASDGLRYFSVGEFFDLFNFSVTTGNDNLLNTDSVLRAGLGVEKEIDKRLGTMFGYSISVLDACDATTGWTGSTDASTIAANTTTYKTSTGSLSLGKSGVTEALSYYRKTLSTQYDFTNGVCMVWVYLVNTTGLPSTGNAVRIKFGSDSSNYYYKDYTVADLLTGWNLLYVKDTDSKVGSPVISLCDSLEVYFTTSTAATTVTAANWIMDSWRLVDKSFFVDEKLDASLNQEDYFLSNKPVQELVWFAANTSAEDETPSWDELTVSNYDIEIDDTTGRVNICDDDDWPAEGKKQIHAVYTFGEVGVPQDIKGLAMLMVARSLMMATVVKNNISGRSAELNNEIYANIDNRINQIVRSYQRIPMGNT